MDDLEKRSDESNADHYARLLAMKQEIGPKLREAKRLASIDVNRAAAEKRYKRELERIEATGGTISDDGESG